MVSIGIDVSKGKSTVFAMDELGVVHMTPTEFEHTQSSLQELILKIREMPEPVKVVLENTGYYHWPLVNALLDADVFVCIVNSLIMNKFAKVAMRPGKTDPLDAVMICRFGLEKWNSLVCCTPEAEARKMLRLYSREYSSAVKLMSQQKIHLRCLLDQTMPGIQNLLCDEGGRSKLCDFVVKFWHFDNISKKKEDKFISAYCQWAKKQGYHANESKAHAIYTLSQNGIPVLPSNKTVKFLVQEAARLLIYLEKSVETILAQMNELASTFPEYDTVITMKGVGPKIAPRLIGEIGDIERFHSAKALVAYAGLDAPPFQSGSYESKNRRISKRENKYIQKIGYEITTALMSSKPTEDNAVYLFVMKKRQEGKHYLAADMAGLNKFLHIYYARVKQCCDSKMAETA